MPALSTPIPMARMMPSGWTLTKRPIRNGCSTWASICWTAMTPASMKTATNGPCETSATSTATEPDTVAPTRGMKAPRKTSRPIAATNGSRRMSATIMIPSASVSATITVARTNLVSDCQAMRPEESTSARESRGKTRTTQDQIRSPSARKKYVAKSTMKKPATSSPSLAPTPVATPAMLEELEVTRPCRLVTKLLIWASLRCSGPVCSQFFTSSRPSLTWLARSVEPAATWVPATPSIAKISTSPPSTTRKAATPRGNHRETTVTPGRPEPRSAVRSPAERSAAQGSPGARCRRTRQRR